MSTLNSALRSLAAELRAVPVPGASWADDPSSAAMGAGLRLVRIRAPRRRWWRQDHGPLLARDPTNGAWLALLPRAFAGLGERTGDGRTQPIDARQAARLGNELFMVYPRWPPGPATVEQWLAKSQPRHHGWLLSWVSTAAAALPPIIPAIAAILLGVVDPSFRQVLVAMLGCLTIAGALAGWTVAVARLQRGRDTNLRLHGLLWDRLLGTSLGVSHKFPQATLAVRLRHALSSAQREAESPDHLREAGIALLMALIVLALASPPIAVICGAELLAPAAVLHCLWRRVGAAMLAAGEHGPGLEQTLSVMAGSVPQFRALSSASWLLGCTARVIGRALASGALADRAVIAARAGERLLFLLQPVAVGAATASGLAGDVALPTLAAAVLAACAAATAVSRISAIIGTRRARRMRMDAIVEALAAPPKGLRDADPARAQICRFESLEVEGVQFGYASATPILRGINLTIGRGEIVALTGPAGSGKTTLLRIIGGLVEPSVGRVLVNGRVLPAHELSNVRCRIGAVFPDHGFAPTTIRAAIMGAQALPFELAEEAARLVGLDRNIARLPMGMQTLIVPGVSPDGLVQRLMIARALAARPQLLLLDDVWSAVEPDARKRLMDELRGRGVTVVLTSLDPAVLTSADRTLRLEGGRITS